MRKPAASFVVGTYKVCLSRCTASIIASYGGITHSAMLTVTPSATAPALSTVSLSPASVTGGGSSTGTVTLTAPAPACGMVVTLASNNTTAATILASVTVARRRDQLAHLHGDHESGDRIHGRRDLGDRGSCDPVGHLDRESGRGGRNRVQRHPWNPWRA